MPPDDFINVGDQVVGSPDPAPEVAEITTPPEAAPFQGYEFDHGGKQVKVEHADPRAKQWIQQGYDYSQRTQALKADRTALDDERSSFDQNFQHYTQIDKYAKENPDWWAATQKSFAERDMQAPGAVQPNPELQGLKREIKNLTQM